MKLRKLIAKWCMTEFELQQILRETKEWLMQNRKKSINELVEELE